MKKSGSWFSCSFFLCSLQGTCPNNCSGAAGTPGAAGEGFRTIVHAGRLPSQGDPRCCTRGTCCRSEQLYAPAPGEARSQSRFRGDYLLEAEQLPRLSPDPAPITPIPLRSEQFFGHRSHTLCK